MIHLLSISELTKNDIDSILRKAQKLKNKEKPVLKGKNVAMLFAKPSTRTRVSFEAAVNQLSGHPLYLDISTTQLSREETISDTSRVLSRYVDCIIARLFKHQHIEELAKASDVPVINGLTDMFHPCQALADMYTIREKLGKLKGLNLTYLGDGNNNVAHSLMYACSRLGVNMTVSCPASLKPDKTVLKETGSRIEKNPKKAVRDSDILYTDVWKSMGEKASTKSRALLLRPYQINKSLLGLAKRSAIVMHCLPAHRGQEITSDVMDGKQSVIFDQAENRLHVAKGILAFLLKS